MLTDMLASRVTSVEQIRGCPVTWEETRDALLAEFGPAIGVDIRQGCLTKEESETSAALIEAKYSRPEWNLLR